MSHTLDTWKHDPRKRTPNVEIYSACLKDMGVTEYIGPVLVSDLDEIEKWFDIEIVGSFVIIK